MQPLGSRPPPRHRPSESEGRGRPAAEQGWGAPWPRGPRARRLKQIHGLHFCRLPGWGWGREEGVESANAQNFLPSPLSLRRQSYKLIWSKKKNNKENV